MAVQQAEVLDVMKGLFEAAQHPDIAEVYTYGAGTKESPGGVAVKDVRGGKMFLVASPWKGETPVDAPEILPPPRQGVQRISTLAIRLLDAAKPALFQAWRLVALPDLGPTDARSVTPAGVSIKCADGTTVLLRAMSGGSQTGDPAEDLHPDWQIPAGIVV
ncbi:hypothetical protein [Actinoplanes missouriensis]|uniref:hypothetical protein n=1 Tax=Actinoplanes missouriensis TaxID=1866 RepID=UPI0012FB9A3B|nr:hypothetical protein [Actinoplanes missouriensis]